MNTVPVDTDDQLFISLGPICLLSVHVAPKRG